MDLMITNGFYIIPARSRRDVFELEWFATPRPNDYLRVTLNNFIRVSYDPILCQPFVTPSAETSQTLEMTTGVHSSTTGP